MRSHATWFLGSLAFASTVWLACGTDVVGVPLPEDGGTRTTPPINPDNTPGDDDDDGPGARDAATDAPTDAREAGCPATGRGPAMVDVGGFCIDSTEVTEAQYAAFLTADAGFGGAPGPACQWKQDFLPANPTGGTQVCRWDPAQFPNLPVVCVDWCDAFAFCKWAGKRLCGAIRGGATSFAGNDYQDATKDQWYAACSKGGAQKYPYGNTFDGGGACNVKDGGGVDEVADAGAFAGCVGGYPGLRDMVGNAFEHVDSCSGTTSRTDDCMIRGGSWFHPDTTFSLCPAYGENPRDARFDDVGFRCCSQ